MYQTTIKKIVLIKILKHHEEVLVKFLYLSEFNGGIDKIENLMPICNSSMSIKDINIRKIFLKFKKFSLIFYMNSLYFYKKVLQK